MLSTNQILAVNDLKTKQVDVPEWGGFVFVRLMDGTQRERIEAEWRKPHPAKLRGLIAVNSLCDETGQLLFTEKDIDALQSKSYVALDRIIEAAASLNEITEGQIEALKKTLKETSSDVSVLS